MLVAIRVETVLMCRAIRAVALTVLSPITIHTVAIQTHTREALALIVISTTLLHPIIQAQIAAATQVTAVMALIVTGVTVTTTLMVANRLFNSGACEITASQFICST